MDIDQRTHPSCGRAWTGRAGRWSRQRYQPATNDGAYSPCVTSNGRGIFWAGDVLRSLRAAHLERFCTRCGWPADRRISAGWGVTGVHREQQRGRRFDVTGRSTVISSTHHLPHPVTSSSRSVKTHPPSSSSLPSPQSTPPFRCSPPPRRLLCLWLE